MGTKMKGLLKGLRYISQIFDEEKEPEMEIGNPTDVKHVAHIGCDGPSLDTPSWMEDFKSPNGLQPSPSSSPANQKDHRETKRTSEDSRTSNKSPKSPENDICEVLKSPRKKDSSAKPRQSRRRHPNESSTNSSLRSNRRLQELSLSTNAPPTTIPDSSKKSRRKKSKESTSGSGSSRSRSKAVNSNGSCTSPRADPGPGTGSILQTLGSEPSPGPSIDGEKRNVVIP